MNQCTVCGQKGDQPHMCGPAILITLPVHPQTCGTCGDVLNTTTCDGCARRDYEGMRDMQRKFIKADHERIFLEKENAKLLLQIRQMEQIIGSCKGGGCQSTLNLLRGIALEEFTDKPNKESTIKCPHCAEPFDIRGGHLCAEKRKENS